ncbi:TetR/AcrR family transcriptional regulator [Actinomadura macrotermitis]|uniref:HTH-type transcriptional repressor ComR n=1 Tax=Actinomadura macrotermitis TaxID=2585200 RepID=A0A7K0BRH2_9ACTN|nr:TetR/AcrR family transcriptional regulator [Actinomadura macrotermitis]MQY03803.1 HTH-type transcriptional repressor ComR [Actinomadura macrotermitis]
MARPRKFDETQAVEAAMRAFWAHGYEATSTEELCAATGIGRSSIYNTFKSKHDLFQKALRHYMDAANARTAELFESGLPVQEKVATLFARIVAEEAEDGIGCLVVNTGVELAPRDPEVAEILRRDYRWRLETLRAAFDKGRRDGDIAAERDPVELAHFVIATVSGMRVAARSGAGRPALEAIAAGALHAL